MPRLLDAAALCVFAWRTAQRARLQMSRKMRTALRAHERCDARYDARMRVTFMLRAAWTIHKSGAAQRGERDMFMRAAHALLDCHAVARQVTARCSLAGCRFFR